MVEKKVNDIVQPTLSAEEIKALIAQAKEEAKAEAKAEFEASQAEKEAAQAADEEKAVTNNETTLAQQEKTMKERLLAEPKETILIPEDQLNSNEPLPVGINGVIFAIPRGIEVAVPMSVAAVWRDSYQRTRAANRKIKVTELKADVEIIE